MAGTIPARAIGSPSATFMAMSMTRRTGIGPEAERLSGVFPFTSSIAMKDAEPEGPTS